MWMSTDQRTRTVSDGIGQFRSIRVFVRAEWTRHWREQGGVGPRQLLGVGLLGLVTTAAGLVAHSTAGSLPPENGQLLYALGTVGFLAVVARSATETKRTLRRLDPELLVTTVPVSVAVAGLFLWVLLRVALLAILPVAGIAVGLAVGTGTPAVAASVAVAAGPLVVVATVAGTTGRLVSRLVGTWFSHTERYNRLLLVVGSIATPLVWAGFVARGNEEAIATVATWAALAGELSPVRLFVELSVVGAGAPIPPSGALPAGVGVVLVVPMLFVLAVRVTARIWTTDRATTSERVRSRSLLRPGRLERLVPGRERVASRPTLVVARETWLRARRSRQVLNAVYLLIFLLPVILASALARVPLLVGFTVLLGFGVGYGFASDPIGRRYRAFPMLLTAVSGRHLVAGIVLAALVVAAPVVAASAATAGLFFEVSAPVVLALWLLGMAACACTATVALAVGLGISYDVYVPVPVFLTDITVYGEIGIRWFLRMTGVFLVVALATSPAFVGSSQRLGDAVGGEPWLPTAGLLLGAALATVVAVVAARIASNRYDSYTIQ